MLFVYYLIQLAIGITVAHSLCLEHDARTGARIYLLTFIGIFGLILILAILIFLLYVPPRVLMFCIRNADIPLLRKILPANSTTMADIMNDCENLIDKMTAL